MKTSQTIAQQSEASREPVTKPHRRETKEEKTARIRPYQFQPGQSGNPKGARKSDVARRIAKQIFENNEEEAYKGLAKALLKGNAYVFDVLAQRAYGKLTQPVELGGAEKIVSLLAEGRKRVAARNSG